MPKNRVCTPMIQNYDRARLGENFNKTRQINAQNHEKH